MTWVSGVWLGAHGLSCIAGESSLKARAHTCLNHFRPGAVVLKRVEVVPIVCAPTVLGLNSVDAGFAEERLRCVREPAVPIQNSLVPGLYFPISARVATFAQIWENR